MIRIPAHKQIDPAKAAGQIKTLGDYIQQKTANDPKKLTFEEWWTKEHDHTPEWGSYEILKQCWDASRANL